MIKTVVTMTLVYFTPSIGIEPQKSSRSFKSTGAFTLILFVPRFSDREHIARFRFSALPRVNHRA